MSGNRIPEAIREEALKLVRHWYADFGLTLAHEYLAREHGLAFSVEMLRQWMIEAGLWQARSRRNARIHLQREWRVSTGLIILNCAKVKMVSLEG